MAKHIIIDNEGDKVTFTIKLYRGLKKGKGFEKDWTEEVHQFELGSIDRIKRFLKYEYAYANSIVLYIGDVTFFKDLKEIFDGVIPKDLPVAVNAEHKNMYIFNLNLFPEEQRSELGVETTFGEIFKGLDSINVFLGTIFEINS
ncbi:hypothetical protein MZM54_05260 [[Brevibacterium] frigoritolerans]|nr:hypothetical protein [Peribacillus frigoritolerans]